MTSPTYLPLWVRDKKRIYNNGFDVYISHVGCGCSQLYTRVHVWEEIHVPAVHRQNIISYNRIPIIILLPMI